jgi:hypothetical protein
LQSSPDLGLFVAHRLHSLFHFGVITPKLDALRDHAPP